MTDLEKIELEINNLANKQKKLKAKKEKMIKEKKYMILDNLIKTIKDNQDFENDFMTLLEKHNLYNLQNEVKSLIEVNEIKGTKK